MAYEDRFEELELYLASVEAERRIMRITGRLPLV